MVPIPALVKLSAAGQPKPPIPTIKILDDIIFFCPFGPIFFRTNCLENLSIWDFFKLFYKTLEKMSCWDLDY